MKFLLIVKDYPPIPDASGQIANIIATKLIEKNHEVHILTRLPVKQKKYEGRSGEQIYSVEYSYWEKLLRKKQNNENGFMDNIWFKVIQFLRKLVLAFQIYKFPNSEPIITKRMTNYCNYLQKINDYDCMISFFRPFSNLETLANCKKRYKQICTIAYYLDLVEGKSCPKFMPVQLFKKRWLQGEQRIYETNDLVILPSIARNSKEILYSQYEHKIEYLEFPTFIPLECQKKPIMRTENTIKLLYAGTLNSSFRNPSELLQIINELAKIDSEQKYVLKFYGGGDCFDIIRNFETVSNLIVEQNGKVPREIIMKEMREADFLINISNNLKSLIPSKIFELFATGKPIINILSLEDDGTLDYFKRYPLVFNVSEKCFEQEIQVKRKLSEFIKQNKGASINIDILCSEYNNCTPEYVVGKLLNCIENYYENNNK